MTDAPVPAVPRSWLFIAGAAIPCLAALLFCAVGIHEWWLISTHQIAVIPTPTRGATSAPEVPAARLLPLILGSGMLAAMFAYALLRGSRGVLLSAYLAVAFVVAVTLVRRMS